MATKVEVRDGMYTVKFATTGLKGDFKSGYHVTATSTDDLYFLPKSQVTPTEIVKQDGQIVAEDTSKTAAPASDSPVINIVLEQGKLIKELTDKMAAYGVGIDQVRRDLDVAVGRVNQLEAMLAKGGENGNS